MKEPCVNCDEKHIDEFGYFCDIACGKRTVWIHHKAGMKEVADCVNECKITTDVFQEDGSRILRMGDIVIPQRYWKAYLKEKDL